MTVQYHLLNACMNIIVQDGNVFICNMAIMDGLTPRDGQYIPAPICLLYVNSADELVPIAIQVEQKPGDSNPIFLPNDNWFDWLFAKTYYQNAQGQVSGETIIVSGRLLLASVLT